MSANVCLCEDQVTCLLIVFGCSATFYDFLSFYTKLNKRASHIFVFDSVETFCDKLNLLYSLKII